MVCEGLSHTRGHYGKRALLAKQCKRVTFEAGSNIMREGDKAEKFYILLHGSAVALKREGGDASDSREVAMQRVLRSYGPGAHFGWAAPRRVTPRRATASLFTTIPLPPFFKKKYVYVRRK